MRETSFIKQNKDKWREFEQTLDKPRKDPDKLNDLFIQITDDLSYSRTFYPNRSVRVYLNGLAQRVFFSIYKNRRSRGRRLLTFWSDELPQLFYEARSEFRLSFLAFLLAALIGLVSGAMDEEFVRVIMGDSYVDMTIENIESGDPMAVYKQKGAFGMSLGITMNNLFVAFLTFVMGAFYMVGSIAILIRNGIMLGAFQYFFIERGLFWESFLTIWIHGTLEISAIVIAGAAGLTMGKGLVFPGTYSRMQAFQRSARRGIKIMVGIAPIIILAGFIEGYLTRHTETPQLIRGLFILGCLAFVLLYFVWYPRMKARAGFQAPIRDTKIPPDSEQRIDFRAIKSSGEAFSEVIVFLKKQLGKVALAAGAGALCYALAVFLLSGSAPAELFIFPAGAFGTVSVLDQFFTNENAPLLPLLNTALTGGLAFVLFRALAQEEGSPLPSGPWPWVAGLLKSCLAAGALQLLALTNDWYTVFLLIALGPIPLVWGYLMIRENKNPLSGLGRALALVAQSYSKAFGLFAILFIVGFLFFALMDTTLAWFFLELVTWVVNMEAEAMGHLTAVLLSIVAVFILHLAFSMTAIGAGLLYYSLLEAREAPDLLKRIETIGFRRSIRGMERE